MNAARTLNLVVAAPRLRRRLAGAKQEWHGDETCNDRDLQHVPSKIGPTYCAVGSNAEAARRAGIGVTGHLVKVYLLSGLLAGAAGFMSLAYYSTTGIAAHSTDNLNAIAAVVMGGTSLFGGVGTMLGTVIGVFIPAVLKKGFNITGVQDYWQMIAVGAVLIAAVWFDQQRRRARNQL